MGYELKGRLAEICSCATYCPCTAGLEPDGGVCDFNWVFHIDAGNVNGVDVAGLRMGFLGRLTGAPAPGRARVAVFVDARATEAQEAALVGAWTGQEGGPLAELAALVGEVAAVERAEIDFDVDKGRGAFRIGQVMAGELTPLTGPHGTPTTLRDFALSEVLGDVAYVAKPASYELSAGALGFTLVPGTATQFEFQYRA
jgi:hypothetical protein